VAGTITFGETKFRKHEKIQNNNFVHAAVPTDDSSSGIG
jgi:hypothetical protein